MTRLLKVESRRFWIRRTTWFVGIGIIASLMFIAFSSYSSIATRADVAQFQAHREASIQEWENDREANVAQCEDTRFLREEIADEGAIEVDLPDLDQDCTVNPYTVDSAVWDEQTFVYDAYDYTKGISGIVVLGVLLIASSLFAAEFTTGALGNWLTFEPRRLRVYFSKVGAAMINTVALAAAALAVFLVCLWATYTFAKATISGASVYWVQLGWLSVRIIVLAALVAAVSSALAALTRHTAAVVAIAGIYLVVLDLPMRGTFPERSPWLLSRNVEAFIGHGTTYSYELCTIAAKGKQVCSEVERTISFAHSSVYIAVVAVVIIMITALVFRRRDVL